MQSSFSDELRRKIVAVVRKVRDVFGSVRSMRRSTDCNTPRSASPVLGNLSNDLDFVALYRQGSKIGSITKNGQRKLESGVDHLNPVVLSGDPGILGESRRICRDEDQVFRSNEDQQQGSIDFLAHFLHLGVRYEGSSRPARDSIESILNDAKSWYRYAPNCWIIYTGRDADYWYDKLKDVPGMKTSASFFICEANLDDRAGWMSKKFWEWIRKNREKENTTVAP
jgi:hypothetical protein